MKIILIKNICRKYRKNDCVLQNNLFEFNSKFYKQISGAIIGTKFVPPYACIFMNHIEMEFLKTQDIKH